MTLILKQIFSLLKLLNSDTGTNQIAAGVAAGLILGFSPILSLQSLLILILMIFLRIQIGAAFVSAFFFSFCAWVLDPVSHSVGRSVLETESLRGLFTTLYNLPIVPFTRFYNSIVMGSGLIAVVLAPIVFFGARLLIQKYRVHVVARFQQTKFWKLVKATAFYQWYAKYDSIFG